tara:strand:+ start:82 stop:315 length:234 start_codon:yes stop_codon:yes gene_type:complete
MSKKYKTWEDWAKDYYGQLVGYKIKEFKIEDDSEIDEGFDSQFPVFVLSNGKEELKISVSQDEEGNGSGFLFIEENK